MFKMCLPFQKDLFVVNYIKEQYPNIRIKDNSKEIHQDFYKYEPCKQKIELSGLIEEVDGAANQINSIMSEIILQDC
jgi:hypothetical protein